MSEKVLTVGSGGGGNTRPLSDFLMATVGEGETYHVSSDSGSDTSHTGKTRKAPFATLDYAIGQCTANQGDRIIVHENHAETVATAGAIAFDVAGIEIICLGEGADRPTFTFSATDATMAFSAASVKMSNFIIAPSIDAVVSPIVISAADVDLDFEVRDASAAVEMERAVLTTAAADNLKLNIRHRGFIAGNACVNSVRLVGVDSARINVDFYGVASTSIVEFHTTACHDIDISGLFYNDGTTLTKNVVDTATGSTWSARGWDGNSNANFSGGDNAALASDDVTALATAIATIDGYHDVATADAATNAVMSDITGNKEDAAATGAVSTTESLMAYAKQNVTNTEMIANGTLPAAPTANSLAAFIASGGTALGQELPDSTSIVDVIGDFTGPHNGAAQDDNLKASLDLAHTDLDAILEDTDMISGHALPADPTSDSLAAFIASGGTALGQELPDSQSLVDLLGDFTGPHDGTAQDDNIKASLDLAHTTLTAVPKCVEKSDGIVASNTTDDLFTIAGGPVRCKIVGLVTTVIGGAANMKLQHTTDDPSATVELNVGAVAINDDAVGTVYHNLGSTSVFTPSGELGVVLLDPVTVEETEFILAPGTVKAHSSAAQTGNIKWYMVYTPLSPSSTVTAAA